jgi:Spy/CpxP family protein refolding chaperone
MARQFGWALVAALLVASAAQAQTASQLEQAAPATPQHSQAQREGRQDRGPWWRQGHPAAKELALTVEQTAAIDRIFAEYFGRAKPLRGEVDQLDKALNRMMQENLVEISTVEQESARIEKKRAELNRMRTVMLYSIRRVLNPEQNVKFQKYQDRVEAERRKQDGDRRR